MKNLTSILFISLFCLFSCNKKNNDTQLKKLITGEWQQVKMETVLNGKLCVYCRNFVSKYFQTLYSSTKTWQVRYGIVQGKIHEYTIEDSILTVKSKEHDLRYKIERISKDSLVMRDSEWHPIFSITGVLKLGYHRRYFIKQK